MKMNAYSTYGFSFTLADLIVNAVIILIIVVIVLWYYIKWNNRHFEKLDSELNGPKAYPIIGAAHHFIGSPHHIIKKIIKIKNDYGPEPFKLWLGPKFAVFIMKPEDVQIVVNNSMALDRSLLRKFFGNILGKGLSTTSIDVWKVHRRQFTPAFNTSMLKKLMTVFNKKTQILIKNLQPEVGKKQSFDLWNYIISNTVDTICESFMGYDVGTESNSDFDSFTDNLEKALALNTMRLYRPWYYPDIVFSLYLRLTGQHTIFDKIKELPNRVIKERKEMFTKNKIANISNVNNYKEEEINEKKDSKLLLDILMELNDIGKDFTDEEVTDEAMTMISAGTETSAITTCLCLLLLAVHQDIQDKVYNELYEVFGNGYQACTYEDMNRLVYLEQVINETLRIFPVVPIFFRTLQDDIKIFSGNLTLPKGTECVICPIGTHYMPDLYPNPSIFNPENFDSENVLKRHKYSFIPFSGGPRNCIGYKYAMLSIKVLVSTLLRNFSVHTDIKFSDIDMKFGLVMRKTNGYPVTIRPRTNIPMY